MLLVHEVSGDLFEAPEKAIGHGVNCQGVMGAGVAAEVARRWPEMLDGYRRDCAHGLLRPGMATFFYAGVGRKRIVVNLATQNRPGKDARVLWVVSSLVTAATYLFCKPDPINEIAIPRVGCGIGGLKWKDVRSAISGCGWDNFKVVVYTLEQK